MENHSIERRKVIVTLKHGLHVRPMSLIAQTAGKFSGSVSIRREDGYAVNAKSMFDLLTLKAETNMALMLEAQGEGACELLDQLESLFASKFGWNDEEEDFVPMSDPPKTKRNGSRALPVEPE
jgi:phosphotransferase system HPr (HPr) family protein